MNLFLNLSIIQNDKKNFHKIEHNQVTQKTLIDQLAAKDSIILENSRQGAINQNLIMFNVF